MLENLYTLPIQQVPEYVAKHAAYFWTLESSLIANHHQMQVYGGMGLDNTIIALPQGEAEQLLIRHLLICRRHRYSTWRGLDVRHIQGQQGHQFAQFDIFAALESGASQLDQSLLDFLTLRDVKDSRLDVKIRQPSDGNIESLAHYDDEAVRLALAFRRQMVEEAEPYRYQVATGIYIMEHTTLPVVDRELLWASLRLIITTRGILASFIHDDWYVPFFWSPDGVNTSQVWLHPRGMFAVDVMLSCIWRDACIVQEAFAEVRHGRKGYTAPGKHQHRSNTIRLPRVVYKSQWGTASDRETTEHQSRVAHTVRGHYRTLADGSKPSESAVEAAEEYHYPRPPEGYTFVRPHIRGEGETSNQPRKVVCRGLQVAKIALS